MAGLISGAAADWLEARRGDLNLRFERARRRFPALSPDAVLSTLAEVLPPLAGPEPGSGDLLSSAYDLVLLHVARESFATRPGISALLHQLFPRLRHLLLQQPSSLPGALSNAVENLGPRGADLVGALAGLSDSIDRGDVLLDAVAVVAWRLGEARLRAQALEIAARLPARLTLKALDLPDWPEAAASLAVEGLRANGWLAPRRRFSERTIAALRSASPQQVSALRQRLAGEAAPPLGTWAVVASVGDFTGFGGAFDTPPLVLSGGGPHHLFARCGGQDYRIDADAFGWICRSHPAVDFPVRGLAPVSGFRKLVARLAAAASSSDGTHLQPDGTLAVAGDSARFPAFAGASSFAVLQSCAAATHEHSHRIRIAAPSPEPL